MDVELLVVPSCPNESAAYNMAVAALADIGVKARVHAGVIASDGGCDPRVYRLTDVSHQWP